MYDNIVSSSINHIYADDVTIENETDRH